MKLSTLIKPLNLDYIDSDITDKNFPDDGKRGTDLKIYHFNRNITSEDATKEMDKEGYRPMTLHELLLWAKDGWNSEDSVVALGSVWRVRSGFRGVACLGRDVRARGLYLDWFGGVWGGDLSVRRGPQVLGHFETWLFGLWLPGRFVRSA